MSSRRATGREAGVPPGAEQQHDPVGGGEVLAAPRSRAAKDAAEELLGLRPGQKVQAIPYEDRIELIPVRRMKEMRGFLRGIDTSVEREPDRA